MKKLLNIVSGNVEKKQINESIVECGTPMPMQSAIPTATPVTMSVNLNAQGIDQIKDLLNLMNKAESPLAPGIVGGTVTPDPIDMLKPPMADKQVAQGPGLDDLADELGMDLKGEEESEDDGMGMDFDMGPEDSDSGDDTSGQKSPLGKMADEVRDMADELADVNSDEEEENESYANSPDEQVSPYRDPAGDDLHKRKSSYSDKPFRGDNPMAVENLKSDLSRLYKQIKEIR